MLRGMRREWTFEFADGVSAALRLLEQRDFDVVVTDMRMPELDGADLLNEVKLRSPRTVRIVLSGQSERQSILRAVSVAHQYLSKPCDPDLLSHTVSAACSLRDRLPDDALKELVSRIESVPSQPEVLEQLRAELSSPDPSIERSAALVALDMGLTAKVLQLVHSSFFAQPKRLCDAATATKTLGLDLLKQLSFSTPAFSRFNGDSEEGFSIEALNAHSYDVATRAEAIASAESNDRRLRDEAYLAGRLHNIGKVVLATHCADEYRAAVRLSRSKQITLYQAEMEIFGASHAEVGSYLVCLWGLPPAVVDAVSHYRRPPRSQLDGYQPVNAVHLANIITRGDTNKCDGPPLVFATELLGDPDFAERVTQWCRRPAASFLTCQGSPP
jgi:HD-like signal output (HDOD) protein